MNEREENDALDQAAAELASWERNRPRVMIGDQDMTEHVVTILDALSGSLDWGSGMLHREDLIAWTELAKALNFAPGEISHAEAEIKRAERMPVWSQTIKRRYW